MKISLLCTGKTTDVHVQELMQVYAKRIGKYCSFKLIETTDVKSLDKTTLKKKETALMKTAIANADHIILLDETGKEFTSQQFSAFVQKKQLENKKHVLFIIGGAFGFSNEMYDLAHEKICLSKMTFPHQLVRLIFLEQLYRAFTILHHEPYHH